VQINAAALALALVACEQQASAPPTDTAAAPETAGPQAADQVQPAMAGPPVEEGSIDWTAARADRAASPAADQASAMVQSATGQTAGPPAVPVLLPSGIVQAQGDNARPPALVATEDGYFASYQMPRYNAVVNGSKRAYVTGAAAAAAGDAMAFTPMEAGAQLAFSRYGADYLIEFECRQIDGSASCITEEEARAFAETLFVAQTQ
jgi:hypothetical protein